MRVLESAGGALCSCGAVLVGGSAGVVGVVCCASAPVAAASATKASAARFTVNLHSLWSGQTKHLTSIEAIGDGLHWMRDASCSRIEHQATAVVAKQRHASIKWRESCNSERWRNAGMWRYMKFVSRDR